MCVFYGNGMKVYSEVQAFFYSLFTVSYTNLLFFQYYNLLKLDMLNILVPKQLLLLESKHYNNAVLYMYWYISECV